VCAIAHGVRNITLSAKLSNLTAIPFKIFFSSQSKGHENMFTFDPSVAVRMFNWMSRFDAIREQTGSDGAFFPTVRDLICLQIPLLSDENFFTPSKNHFMKVTKSVELKLVLG
jgi:hypothetical protein